MDFCTLVASLPTKKNAVFTLEAGKTVKHSYSALFDDVVRTREKMRAWGVKAGMRVGIYAPNSYQWLVHDLALIELGAISVPFTDDFAGSVNGELLDRYNIGLLLIAQNSSKLFAPKPAHVAFIDGENGDVRALETQAYSNGDEPDHHSLAFSSGSAGGLKGLVISRKGIETTLPPIIDAIGVEADDRLMLFLPMSNFQQRNMCYAAIWKDIDVVITDYTQLFAAMKVLNPSILIAPPVLYQMMHAEFTRYPDSKQKRWKAVAAALSLIPVASLRRKIARHVFQDFYKQFGGRMRVLITGMAPIQREIAEFFDRMQLPLCESYGMVEAGSLTYRHPKSKTFGSVGKPLDGVRLTLEEDGEIIAHRDHSLTLRYFQCAEGENERTFIGANRIATGDIGKFDGDGNLYLLGRKKEQIITPGGYKIYPEVIEKELNGSPDIANSVVFLRKETGNLVCVLVLTQPDDADTKKRVSKFVAGMKSYKKAAQFMEAIIADEPFSAKNGLLRPNLKLDRRQIAAKYSI